MSVILPNTFVNFSTNQCQLNEEWSQVLYYEDSMKEALYGGLHCFASENSWTVRCLSIFIGPALGITSGIITIAAKIAMMVEGVIRGIAHLFGSLCSKDYNPMLGVAYLVVALIGTPLWLPFSCLSAIAGIVGKTLGLAWDPASYTLERQIFHHSAALKIGANHANDQDHYDFDKAMACYQTEASKWVTDGKGYDKVAECLQGGLLLLRGKDEDAEKAKALIDSGTKNSILMNIMETFFDADVKDNSISILKSLSNKGVAEASMALYFIFTGAGEVYANDNVAAAKYLYFAGKSSHDPEVKNRIADKLQFEFPDAKYASWVSDLKTEAGK